MPDRRGAALLWAALAAWAAVATAAGVIVLAPRQAADILAGEHIPGMPDRPNRVRNALELVSFASGAGVVVAALAALGQLRAAAAQNRLAAEAERDKARSAKAEVDWRLFAQLAAPEVEQGLEVCRALGEAWSQLPEPRPAFGEFVCARMDGALPDTERWAALRLLSIVENQGLLVRLELIDIDDVFYTFEGILRTVQEVFGTFMRRNRALSPGKRESEHALWLLDRIATHKPARVLPR